MTRSEIFKRISERSNADLFIFSANVSYPNVDELIHQIRRIKTRKENCIILLTTYGGDPDAGFRLVRYVRRKYKKLTLYVFGTCKSTGTLIALGANEIVIGDFGEFGPLDIQLTKDDELTNTSGLSYLQSLISLNERVFSSFEDNFKSLKKRSTFGYSITTKTAAEIGSKLATGLIQPIAGQIDPLKLGEVQRAIKIAEAYGERLLSKKGNNAIKKLIGAYPSHSFVIDFEEVKELFKGTDIEVRMPDEVEELLERQLLDFVRLENDPDIILFLDLNDNDNQDETQNTATDEQPAA